LPRDAAGILRGWPRDEQSEFYGPLSSFAEALSPSASERSAAGFKKFGPLASATKRGETSPALLAGNLQGA